MTITIYGIPNCDTVRKARVRLDAAGVAHTFHDYRKAGVPEAALRGWVARVGWEALLNRTGTTFRQLPEAERADLDVGRAVALMLTHPAAIRRPVVEHGDALLVGLRPDEWARAGL